MLESSLNQFLIKIKITTTIRYIQKNAPINQLKYNHKNEIWRKRNSKKKFYTAKKPKKIGMLVLII